MVQGVKCQPMTVQREHAEGCKKLKHLLLHHGVGGVQRCVA